VAVRRGIWLVLGLIGLAVFVSMAGVVALYFLMGRQPTVARDSTLVLRVRGDLTETEPGGLIGQLLVSPPTVRSLVDNLRKAKVDNRVSGVVLVPGDFGAMWGKMQEIRDAIADYRTSGKPIVAYLQYGGAQEYYLATACDRIFLMPTSSLELTGVAHHELFLRGTLDKIGVYPDLLHIGEYKTAANAFTERGFTPAHREMAESLAADAYEQLVQAIADGRGKSEADVRALLDEGPFLADEALRRGLVDDLAYVDEVDEKAGLPREADRRLDGDDYRRVSPRAVGLDRGEKVALIYVVGMIVTGQSRYDSPQGPLVGSETLNEYIRRAREDRAVRAIVLRIDSPGGSAVASDAIWRELQMTRHEKPVVVSMSDLAASGGYYIAMPAHAIVSQPGTLTGSIGIVSGKMVLDGTLDKLGMSVDSVTYGRYAGMHAPFRPYTPEERQRVEQHMRAFYDQWLDKAADARDTTPDGIDAIARGRVWTGRQAREIGLVDEIGGLQHALAIAKERAGLDPDAEVELVVYPRRRPLFDLIGGPFLSGGAEDLARLVLLFASTTGLNPGPMAASVTGVARAPALHLFRRGEPLALMPNVFGH
jgi:protease IV